MTAKDKLLLVCGSFSPLKQMIRVRVVRLTPVPLPQRETTPPPLTRPQLFPKQSEEPARSEPSSTLAFKVDNGKSTRRVWDMHDQWVRQWPLLGLQHAQFGEGRNNSFREVAQPATKWRNHHFVCIVQGEIFRVSYTPSPFSHANGDINIS